MRSDRRALALALAAAGCVENHVQATLSAEIGPWLCGAGEGEPLFASDAPVAQAGRCRFTLAERTLLCAADDGRFATLGPELVPVSETRALVMTRVPRGRPWLVELGEETGFPTWGVDGLEAGTSFGGVYAVAAPGSGRWLVAGDNRSPDYGFLGSALGTATRGGGTLTVEPVATGGNLLPTRTALCSLDFYSGQAAIGRVAPERGPLLVLSGAPAYVEARTYGATALVPPSGDTGMLYLLDADCRPDAVVRTWPLDADPVAFQVFARAETTDPWLYSLIGGDAPALRRTRWPAPDRPESIDAPLPDFDTSRQATVLVEGSAAVVVQAASGPGGLRLTHVAFDAPGGPALSTTTFTAAEAGSLSVTRAHFEDENDGHVRFFSTRAHPATDWNDVWRLDFEVRCDAP